MSKGVSPSYKWGTLIYIHIHSIPNLKLCTHVFTIKEYEVSLIKQDYYTCIHGLVHTYQVSLTLGELLLLHRISLRLLPSLVPKPCFEVGVGVVVGKTAMVFHFPSSWKVTWTI